MSSQSEPQSVDTEDDYIHVRYRDPDEFDTIRTPDWADHASDAVSEGSEVRMGKRDGSDDWAVQSVLIKQSVGEEKAREQAEKIVRKLSE